VAAAAKAVPGLGRVRLVVSRAGEQDLMTLRAEHADAGVAETLRAKLAEATRLKGDVEIVAPGSLPNDGKLIVDER
jgi:phenylacetate-CoA ligase